MHEKFTALTPALYEYMTLHRPSLADAFFALTGRALRDDDGPGAAP